MACAERGTFAAIAFAVLLSGCAAPPPAPDGGDFPATPASRDLRAAFRAAACPGIAAAGLDCERSLRREGDEPGTQAPAALPDGPRRFRVGLVPGFFAQCLSHVARPFADVEAPLRARGWRVDYLDVPGRGSVEANAAVLAKALAADDGDRRPWILIAYSKGASDALATIANHPADGARVAAVITIASAALGTPLADDFAQAYRELAAWLPLRHCAAGTGEEVEDLRPGPRRDWWARHGAAVTVPVYSLVAWPREKDLSLAIRSTYRSLAAIDPRNDGKVLWRDQLVPGGHLLGFVNADHWTVAVPLAERLPALAFAFPGPVPRAAILEAALGVAAARAAR